MDLLKEVIIYVTSLTNIVERRICNNTILENSRDLLVDLFNDESYYGSEAASRKRTPERLLS